MDGFFGWAVAFLIVISLPFAGQLVGYFSYRQLSKRSDLMAHLAGVLIPPIAFFFHLGWLTGFHGLTREDSIILVGGTAFEFLIALAIQLALHNYHKLGVETQKAA